MKKLDRRMNGYGDFQKYVEFNKLSLSKFCEVRAWCWEQWGPSCELEYWKQISNPNPAWCWITDEWRIRIYLASNKEAQWFLLKWGKI